MRKTDPQQRRKGQGHHNFSEIVLCQECFPGNPLLCHSPRDPKFFWPPHSQIFVRGIRKVSNLWCYDYWKVYLWARKLNLFTFADCSEQNSPPARRKLLISPEQHFLEIYFSHSRLWRIMELKKWPKLNLRGYWSQVLISCTIFATFTFFISVLLYHNLDWSMRKCEL